MARQPLHLIVIGDLIESAGTRSYLRELIQHLDRIGLDPRCHIFQFRFHEELPAGENRVADFDRPVFLAPGGGWFRLLPRPVYRLIERIALFRFLRRSMRQVMPGDALIGCGCLGLLHVAGRQLPSNSWWLKLGLIEEEGAGTFRYRIRKRIEALHAKRFHHRIVVSGPMGEFIDSEYGRSSGEMLILPCLVDLDRFPPPTGREQLRADLGFQERFVLTYVGTAAPWQCAEETVAFFALLRERMPDAFLWIFTPDADRFETLLKGLPADSWAIGFRPHHELAGLLPAADIGCLLRRRELVNRVASPLKFPEYLACGLPVLIGPEVGGYSRVVELQKLGAIIDPDLPGTWSEVIDSLPDQAEADAIRHRCRLEAEKLSWQAFGSELARVFNGEHGHGPTDSQEGK